ncbi:MAG: hypothetical protein GY869_12865 [Planctomycetes bacterium]|nr:hypothetical protein [Planctomycetota bacterium]
MPLIYETTVDINDDGKVDLHLEDLPFTKGTRCTLKLIPDSKLTPRQVYMYHLNLLKKSFKAHDPFQGMTDDEVTTELRRQREAMYEN